MSGLYNMSKADFDINSGSDQNKPCGDTMNVVKCS